MYKRLGLCGIALLALVLCVLVSGCVSRRAGTPERSDEVFRFAVMADCQTTEETRGVYSKATLQSIDDVNLLDPDFGIIAGDLICGYQDDRAVMEKERDAFDELLKRFTIPVYFLPGNHDSWSQMAEDVYLERCGKLYYSFDHRGSHFILLDSEKQGEVNRIAGEQLAWLKDDLNKHKKAKHIFVFLHKPLWEQEQGEGSSEQGEPRTNWLAEVHPLLSKYGVDAVFAGHWHNYEKCETKDRVRYIVVSTMGASVGKVELLGEFHHIMLVSVRREDVKPAVVKTGNVKPEDYVTTESSKKVVEVLRQIALSYSMRPSADDYGKSYKERFVRTMKNPFNHEMKGKVTWAAPSELWHIEPTELSFKAPAGGSAELAFDVSVDQLGLGLARPTFQGTLEVMPDHPELPIVGSLYIAGAARISRLGAPVQLDGDLAEWKRTAPTLVINRDWEITTGKEHWSGPDDLTAYVRVGYDEESVYVSAEIIDDDLLVGEEASFRDGDGIAFFFSADPPVEDKDPNRIHIRTPKGDQKAIINVKGALPELLEDAEVAAKEGPWGYGLELKLPKKLAMEHLLPQGRKSFLFTVTVYDFDAGEETPKKSSHAWMGNPGVWSDPMSLGQLVRE